MREPPSFAITESPLVPYPGFCNYQTFCKNLTKDGIQMIGLRATESIQRLKCISAVKRESNLMYPIYDWKDNDVWLYIKENNIEFPEIYIRLYEAGVSKRRLRLCSFFGDTTTAGLKWIAETEPELWEKIERRYPNAYLVLLYWDSEMFKRSSKTRREIESELQEQDYKYKLTDLLFINTKNYTIPPETLKKIDSWRKLVKDFYGYMSAKFCKRCYEAILCGDPKNRTLRALYYELFNTVANESREEQGRRNEK